MNKVDNLHTRLVLVETLAALATLFLIRQYPDARDAWDALFLLFSVCFLVGIGIWALGNAIDEDTSHFDGRT